jgi:hypothetical protein
MKRTIWEYGTLTVLLKDDVDVEMNKLGQEGWECYQIVEPSGAFQGRPAQPYHLCRFKRPIENK